MDEKKVSDKKNNTDLVLCRDSMAGLIMDEKPKRNSNY